MNQQDHRFGGKASHRKRKPKETKIMGETEKLSKINEIVTDTTEQTQEAPVPKPRQEAPPGRSDERTGKCSEIRRQSQNLMTGI